MTNGDYRLGSRRLSNFRDINLEAQFQVAQFHWTMCRERFSQGLHQNKELRGRKKISFNSFIGGVCHRYLIYSSRYLWCLLSQSTKTWRNNAFTSRIQWLWGLRRNKQSIRITWCFSRQLMGPIESFSSWQCWSHFSMAWFLNVFWIDMILSLMQCLIQFDVPFYH